MENAIFSRYGGQQTTVGPMRINRMLPNRRHQAIGPFVFLDYLYPTQHAPKKPEGPNGQFAHPHRGIATFTYLFSGSLEHYDSAGHHGIVEGGGAQWMKAGTGVMHDENPSPRFQAEGGLLHALQFWVNLPAKNKAEAPDYRALQAAEVPEIELPDGAGVLRVVIGSYEGRTSPVPTYSQQFIYHLRLRAGATATLALAPGLECAAFFPTGRVAVQGTTYGLSELAMLESEAAALPFVNESDTELDIIVFGGEYYAEPIIAQGPFVMNSRLEIAEAYADFHKGKYGKITYEPLVA